MSSPRAKVTVMTMKTFLILLVVGLILILVGILCLTKGVKKKNRCSASAPAVIVEVQVDDDEAGREGTRKKYTYTPVYEFTTPLGYVRKTGGIYSHSKSRFKVGQTTEVKYDPAKPDDFLVGGKISGLAFDVSLILFGILVIVLAFTQL